MPRSRKVSLAEALGVQGELPLLPARMTFATLLQELFQRRFTGTLVLHLHGGIPRLVEHGRVNRTELLTQPVEGP